MFCAAPYFILQDCCNALTIQRKFCHVNKAKDRERDTKRERQREKRVMMTEEKKGRVREGEGETLKEGKQEE